MLSDLITDLHREVVYNYKDENNKDKKIIFKVKGLSLKGLANLFNHESHGILMLSFVEGIKLENNKTNDIKESAVKLLDSNYASLVYHFIASCVYNKDAETGEYYSCADEYNLFDELPTALTIKLLYNAIELSLPDKEFEVKQEIKKLMALLIQK